MALNPWHPNGVTTFISKSNTPEQRLLSVDNNWLQLVTTSIMSSWPPTFISLSLSLSAYSSCCCNQSPHPTVLCRSCSNRFARWSYSRSSSNPSCHALLNLQWHLLIDMNWTSASSSGSPSGSGPGIYWFRWYAAQTTGEFFFWSSYVIHQLDLGCWEGYNEQCVVDDQYPHSLLQNNVNFNPDCVQDLGCCKGRSS